MTRLLEKAFEKASELPDDKQDQLAAFILEKLESEQQRDDVLDKSQAELDRLAEEALSEYEAEKSDAPDAK